MQGRQGGVQTVQIGRRCASPASLLHHLGHVMGLSVHGDGHTRSQQAQNQLLIGDMIHHVAELQAPSTESVMLLKYMELTNKAQRRLGLSKVVPGKFDVAVLGLKYAACKWYYMRDNSSTYFEVRVLVSQAIPSSYEVNSHDMQLLLHCTFQSDLCWANT